MYSYYVCKDYEPPTVHMMFRTSFNDSNCWKNTEWFNFVALKWQPTKVNYDSFEVLLVTPDVGKVYEYLEEHGDKYKARMLLQSTL